MKSHFLAIIILAAVILASACSKVDAGRIGALTPSKATSVVGEDANSNETEITAFLSRNCSCCKSWISYLKQHHLQVTMTYVDDMHLIKERYQIPPDMVACHTAVIGNYFIEGHIAIEAMEKLLAERPAVDGIVLPGMPSGSPGMGGLPTKPLTIYSVSDGTPMEFMRIDKPR